MSTAVVEALRRRMCLDVADLGTADYNRADLLPTFLQTGADVHGSHGLFYWLRARGSGHILTTGDAAMILSWRRDVDRIVAFRPVGRLDAVVALLEAAGAAAAATDPLRPFVVRYCGSGVASRLWELGWTNLSAPWQPGAPQDDETHPEVIVTAPAVEFPPGQRYKSVREAIVRHGGRYTYTCAQTPLGIGEAEFIASDNSRVRHYDEHETSFNSAVLTSLDARRHDWLTYHYLTCDRQLAGFAITANVTGIAHGYYLSTRDVPRLTTYLLWLIYLQQRRTGASALNLGGSEAASLHGFKIRTFPDHIMQRTEVLQRPPNPQPR